MNCVKCGRPMGRPKYFNDGYRYFHVYHCAACGHEARDQRPHEEFLENERAMRQLDARDCENINAHDGGDFNYGRGR